MPKVDRAEQMKKQAAKTSKVVSQEKAKEVKTVQVVVPAAPQNGRGSAPEISYKKPGTIAGNSSFSKAANLNGGEDDYEDDYNQAEEPASPSSPQDKASAKKAPAKKSKKEQYKDDMQLLLEEQQAAMKARVVQRLLRFFVIGFVQEMWSAPSSDRPAAKEGKPKKKGGNDDFDSGLSVRSLKGKADVYGGPLMLLAFMVLLMAARLGEEGYNPDNRRDNEANFYDVMGVSSDASTIQVRKAYKALALSWHPDKNPECEECPDRFAKISKAYETLSSPERRKAYDDRRAPEGSLDSLVAVELTAEDFEMRVLRSNEVWIVQAYDPNDKSGACQHFHPVFEDVASANQHLARFGRIDINKQRKAAAMLPQRVVVLPVIFRFARGHDPEIFLWHSHAEEQSGAPFVRFIMDSYPKAPRLNTASEVQSWWASDRPRLLVAGPGGNRARQSMEFMHVQRLAHTWAEFCDIAVADAKQAAQALGLKAPAKNSGWSIISSTGEEAGGKAVLAVSDMKEIVNALKPAIERVVSSQVPVVTLRNHQQLCGTGSLHSKRSFCLMLVDTTDKQSMASVVSDLNVSLSSYHQELLELGEAAEEGEEQTEEQLHIQPVRIMTSSSRLPWQPAGASAPFFPVWSEANKAQAFLVELETRRIAAVRGTGMRDLYQQIAYEDLKFSVLPEGLSVAAGFPDPEVAFRRALQAMLSTLPGGTVAFLVAAVAYAVLPELPLATTGAAAAAAAAFLLVSWPVACRRFMMTLWCTLSPSAYECNLHA